MICGKCKNKQHEACKSDGVGKTPPGCDCQHRVPSEVIPDTAGGSPE
jgi:hypothetical protein